MTKSQLHNLQELLFNIFIIVSYSLIILSFFDISQSAQTYLQSLDYYIRIYVCLFLMWRFNPFRSSYEFTNLDRKIAFSAGLLILTTTALNQYLNEIKNIIKQFFS
jgi:hypothetical protein